MPMKAQLFLLPRIGDATPTYICRAESYLNRLRWSSDLESVPTKVERVLDMMFTEPPTFTPIEEDGMMRYTMRTPLATFDDVHAIIFWFERLVTHGAPMHDEFRQAAIHEVDPELLTRLLDTIKTVRAARLPFLSHDLLPISGTILNLVNAYDETYYAQLERVEQMLARVHTNAYLLDFVFAYAVSYNEPVAPVTEDMNELSEQE